MMPRAKNKQGPHKKSLSPTLRRRLRTKLLIMIMVIIYFLLNMCHLPDIVNGYHYWRELGRLLREINIEYTSSGVSEV